MEILNWTRSDLGLSTLVEFQRHITAPTGRPGLRTNFKPAYHPTPNNAVMLRLGRLQLTLLKKQNPPAPPASGVRISFLRILPAPLCPFADR
jgi:hypothetical protein